MNFSILTPPSPPPPFNHQGLVPTRPPPPPGSAIDVRVLGTVLLEKKPCMVPSFVLAMHGTPLCHLLTAIACRPGACAGRLGNGIISDHQYPMPRQVSASEGSRHSLFLEGVGMGGWVGGQFFFAYCGPKRRS